jgi:type IV pilus assembly protein PilV
MQRRTPRPIARSARRSQGFALIESLIALLIFMLATLGLVGLQMSMSRANSGAKFRADAAYLANDLVGTMWTDAPQLASYATASCAGYTRCAAWESRLHARLPGASYEITPDGSSGQVTISIRWTVPEEGSHAFNTSTAINMNL